MEILKQRSAAFTSELFYAEVYRNDKSWEQHWESYKDNRTEDELNMSEAEIRAARIRETDILYQASKKNGSRSRKTVSSIFGTRNSRNGRNYICIYIM